MENFDYSELKSSLSAIPVYALNVSSRLTLADNLDFKQALRSEKGFARDYRGLAELIGFRYYAIKRFEEFADRTSKILESWETRPDATLDKLITYLEDMDRHDIIQELIPALKKDAEIHLKCQDPVESPIQVAEVSSGPANSSSRRNVITKDDLKSAECTLYDAYVSYAYEDRPIAKELASILESPQVGLKVLIPERDILPGCFELEAYIELVKNRCRHVLLILTPNFIKNPSLEFQVCFAGTIAIEQKERILVPVILTPCEIPPILNTVYKIDFTQLNSHDWMMDKLITSLMREDKMHQSAACSGMHQSAAYSDSNEVPSFIKQFSKKFQQFMSFNSTSPSSASFSSGATSGFYSQSSSNI